MAVPTRSILLDLPLELRTQIYGYVLHSPHPILLLSRSRNRDFRKTSHTSISTLKVLTNEPFAPSSSSTTITTTTAAATTTHSHQIPLFLVSHQMHTESRPIFFALNTFTIPLCGWLPWIRPAIIPRRDWNLIGQLKVTIYIQPCTSSIKYCGMSGPAWLDNELSSLCTDRPHNLNSLKSLVVVVKPVCYLSSSGATVRPQWLDDCLAHCVTPLTKLKQLQEVEFVLYAELSEEKRRLAWEKWKEENYGDAEADLDAIKVSFKLPEESSTP